MTQIKIPKLTVLIINGVSGSGKTTTAKTLFKQINNCIWIHPDGLWDTPNMEPELILKKAVGLLKKSVTADTDLAIIDCQIRPSDIGRILSEAGISSWEMVLHSCSRTIRESRLLARGWDNSDFENIENWSRLLTTEAKASGSLIVDSSTLSTKQICERINNQLQNTA